jgi:peptide-methionine (S)-S-oxide reductase
MRAAGRGLANPAVIGYTTPMIRVCAFTALIALLLGALVSCGSAESTGKSTTGSGAKTETGDTGMNTSTNREFATFGLGCFWCSEVIFQRLDGVQSVVSGYEGGKTDSPTYKEVCSGESGHAEVVRIEYDPARIGFSDLLDVFWKIHDPTQLNRQGADVGTQYRSVVFYHSEEQKAAAEAARKAQDASGNFKKPIVTEISPSTKFYPAEDYHQDYYDNNPRQPYCVFNIAPKLKKMGMSTDPEK